MDIFSKKSIGLDIADHTIEVVEIESQGDKFKIISNNHVPLETGIVEQGRIKDEKKLGEIIAKLFKEAKPQSIAGKKVIFGLPESQIYTYVFELGPHKEKERENLVVNEAKKFIPLEEDSFFYYYQVVKTEIKDEKEKTEIMFAASSKESIIEWFNFFRKNGIEIDYFDIEPLAVFRGLFAKNSELPIAIIDLGAANSRLYLYDKDGLRYSFVTNIAGDKITKEISEKLQIPLDEAEKQKIQQGLSGENSEIKDAIKNNLDEIISEINKSFSFYSVKTGLSISGITLVGGTSETSGLLDYFKTLFSIPVDFGKVALSEDSVPFEYLEAVGLACLGLGRKIYKNEEFFDLDKIKKDAKILEKITPPVPGQAISPKEVSTKEKNFGAIALDEGIGESDEEAGEKGKEEAEEERLEKIENINKQISSKLHTQKIILIIILAIGVMLVCLAFLYRYYWQSNTADKVSAELSLYSQEQSIDLIVPLATDSALYSADRVSGRIIEDIVEQLGGYDSLIKASGDKVRASLNAGESLLAVPINKAAVLAATTTPVAVDWIAFREDEANFLFLNAVGKLNKTNEKFIIDSVIKNSVQSTSVKGIYDLSGTVKIMVDRPIEISK
jgi:type IV pilus assembly protein PilM